MENKELIIISTTLDAPKKTKQLLNSTAEQKACNSVFGNPFYPIIGISNEGCIKCICDNSHLLDEFIIIVILDSRELDNDFLKFITHRAQALNVIYLLLHGGGISKYYEHQKQMFAISNEIIAKTRVAKCHHTISHTQNPQYALGDGLEMVAAAILESPINPEAFTKAVNYLKTKPEYYNPVKESLIHLYKSLKLAPLEMKEKWREEEFENRIAELQNSPIISWGKEKLTSILFKKEVVEYYKQLESIEKEITQLS